VKVDITIHEVLSFPLADRTVLRGYAEFADLPENRSILVYSLDEIAAEKAVALTDPARNEPRDLYDLWYLTTNEELQLDHLLPAICQKPRASSIFPTNDPGTTGFPVHSVTSRCKVHASATTSST
jgi:predicted nucleotidyltransferase component of viral defense system